MKFEIDTDNIIDNIVSEVLEKEIDGKTLKQWMVEIAKHQWISVKDRLPEDTRFVLVCNDDKKIMVAQYIDETAQWQYPYIAYDVDVWDDDEQGPIMWWMPLPEAPKEDDHATDRR